MPPERYPSLEGGRGDRGVGRGGGREGKNWG